MCFEECTNEKFISWAITWWRQGFSKALRRPCFADNQKQNKQAMVGNMMVPGGMGQPQMGPGGGAMPNQMGPGGIPDPLSSLQHMTFTPGMQPQQMGMIIILCFLSYFLEIEAFKFAYHSPSLQYAVVVLNLFTHVDPRLRTCQLCC